jgi:hypothetical protein
MDLKTQQSLETVVSSTLLNKAKDAIAGVIASRNGKAVGTVIEVVSVVCGVVEAVSAKLAGSGETIHGKVKADLACSIAETVLDELHKRNVPLVTKTVYEQAKTVITDTKLLMPMIEGIIAIAETGSFLQKARNIITTAQGCGCFG